MATHRYANDLGARSKAESDTLSYYYEILREKMMEAGHEITFTLEALKRSYRLCKVVGASRMLVLYTKTVNSLAQIPHAAPTEEHTKKFKDIAMNGAIEAVQILHRSGSING
ncbi:hypothetical protein DdX_17576 [Ditylenchus destructor]|uniref:Uncharacterized protein n=1 Tax=Ditylenchus destructor TaxID=166010 RepID=A0AAD4MR35_9BILA|nr:hypothetical protein DdX_17576 [Ditylenchus destructor]